MGKPYKVTLIIFLKSTGDDLGAVDPPLYAESREEVERLKKEAYAINDGSNRRVIVAVQSESYKNFGKFTRES